MTLRALTVLFALIGSGPCFAEPSFWCSLQDPLNPRLVSQIAGTFAVRGCSQPPCQAWVRLSGQLPGPSGSALSIQADLYGSYADADLFEVSGDESLLKMPIEATIDFTNDGTPRRQSFIKIGPNYYSMMCRNYEYNGCPSGMSCGH